MTARLTDKSGNRGGRMTTRWPALMKLRTVAEYLDCTAPAFIKEVAA